MAGTQPMPFDVDSWRTDDELAACSEATRGVWMYWLAAMWKRDRCGVLAGRPEYLADIGRTKAATVEVVITELTATRAADVTDNGDGTYTVINRRMKRAYDKRKGGAERQRAFTNRTTATELTPATEELFERFWAAFPKGRKKSKGPARAAFARAMESGVDPEAVIVAAAEYALSEIGMSKWVKMPTTWLNQCCWDDDRSAWLDSDRERSWMPVSAATFKELFRAKKFAEGFPQRDKVNPLRVYGKLRDGRQVDCNNYPPAPAQQPESKETTPVNADDCRNG